MPGIKDRNIAWKRHRDFIPFKDFLSVQPNATPAYASLGTGAPESENINSLGLIGGRLAALTDQVLHMMRIPEKWDLAEDLHFRVHWMSNDTVAAQTATFTLLYDQIAEGAALAAPATALSTPLVADEDSVVAYGLNVSDDKGILAGDTLSKDRFLVLSLAITDDVGLDVTSDEVFLLGLEIEYMPKLTEERT